MSVVSGRVEDFDGSPAVGATVYLNSTTSPLGELLVPRVLIKRPVQRNSGEWEWSQESRASVVGRPVTSAVDSEGVYRFGDEEVERLSERGPVRIWARRDLMVSQILRLEPERLRRVALLRLAPCSRLHVGVYANGKAVPDAYVDLRCFRNAPSVSAHSLLFIGAKTDASGKAYLPPFPGPVGEATLFVQAENLPDHSELVSVQTGESELTVDMDVGMEVRGRAVLEGGRSASGVTVVVLDKQSRRVAEAGRDGYFHLRGVPKSGATLWFVRPQPLSSPPPPLYGLNNCHADLSWRTSVSHSGPLLDLGDVRLEGQDTEKG